MKFKQWLELVDPLTPPGATAQGSRPDFKGVQRAKTDRKPWGLRSNPGTHAFPTGSLPGNDPLPGNDI